MRWLVGAGLLLAMLAFGIGVYHAAGYFKADHIVVHRPNEISAPALPGTIYVVQSGAVYRFQHGTFRQITSEDGWMQPAAGPSGQLVVVRRQGNLSDVYVLSTGGRKLGQLTSNAASSSVEGNHWSFNPRLSPDGATLFYAYDEKDPFNPYHVDLAIYAHDLASGRTVQWTSPNEYTGGDVNPVPMDDGGLVYTKYSVDDSFKVHAQVWIQKRPRSAGQALTAPELGCGQPALSPDEKLIAMVCTRGSTTSAELDVASFDNKALAIGSPATLVSGLMVASPTFSPDSRTIAYLAPAAVGGQFQLWTVGSSGPVSARAITTDLGLDATSAPVWASS
jgi:Tol biopolymer transport system component